MTLNDNKKRINLKQVRNLINSEDIKIITGIHRSGKTCLLKLIIDELKQLNVKEENIIYISFESSKYHTINTYKQLNKLIYSLTEKLSGKIFDEIQEVTNGKKASHHLD